MIWYWKKLILEVGQVNILRNGEPWYPRDTSTPIQARLAKFGPKMHNTLVKVPYCFGGQSPLTLKVKFNLKVKIYPILSLSAP